MRKRLRDVGPNERFDCYVVKQDGGCWLWMDEPHRYGRIRIKGDKYEAAHRFSYRRFVGEIPSGMYVCHKCDTPGCVNPDHLYVGTHEDNTRDAKERGRVKKSERWQIAIEQQRATTPHVRELIKQDYAKGVYTMIDLAKMYGVSQSTISCTIRGAHNQGNRNGEQKRRRTGHFRSKITEAQRDEIRQKYATGSFTQTQLAVEYGVTQTRVSDIITGRDYRRSSPTPETLQ